MAIEALFCCIWVALRSGLEPPKCSFWESVLPGTHPCTKRQGECQLPKPSTLMSARQSIIFHAHETAEPRPEMRAQEFQSQATVACVMYFLPYIYGQQIRRINLSPVDQWPCSYPTPLHIADAEKPGTRHRP